MASAGTLVAKHQRFLSDLQRDMDKALQDIPLYKKYVENYGTETRPLLHLKGVLDTGDPHLFRPCKEVSQEDLRNDKEVVQLIDDLATALRKSRYIALAAPQFGALKRLIVMGARPISSPSSDDAEIPFQVWANPEISPKSSNKVLSWEKYATNPDQEVLVSSYDSIQVTGRLKEQSSGFHPEPVTRDVNGWPARAFQALTCYFEGRLPHERVIHPFFNITRLAFEKHWESLVPFRLRSSHQNRQPILDIDSDFRHQAQHKIDEAWQKHSSWYSQTFDILGFLSLSDQQTISPRILETLPELLDDSFRQPTWCFEKQLNSQNLARIFRLDLTDNMLSGTVLRADAIEDSFHNPNRRSSTSPVGEQLDAESMPTNQPLSNPSDDLSKDISPQTRATYEAFKRDLPELFKSHAGKVVFYHGSKQVMIADDQPSTWQRLASLGYNSDTIICLPIESGFPFEDENADWLFSCHA